MMLHHFYHLFADGDWLNPVTEHFDALTRYGLLDELDSLHVGVVGSDENVATALSHIAPFGPLVCATAPAGWEQVTLQPLWEWCQDHDGLVSYAHTKGAANYNPVNREWRRSMEYHCFVQWREPVEALTNGGATIAGCHWYQGGQAADPANGHGGMFGGNYWWTRCDLLRQNCPPGVESRWAAEHWLGQLSEVMPITPATIHDMHPGPVGATGFNTDW